MLDYLVVGGGLAGAAFARKAHDAGKRVAVVEKNKVGGNLCEITIKDCRVSLHGPHFFHTNSRKVMEFMERFGEWYDYKYKSYCLAENGYVYPFPISKETLSCHDGLVIKPVGCLNPAENAETWLHSQWGVEITDLFFRGYSEKQWGRPLSEIPSSVVRRVSADRIPEKSYYFTDKYQKLPVEGFQKIVENMLHGITVYTGMKHTSFAYKHLVWTGRLDEAFGEDRLPYRSLSWHGREGATAKDRPGPVINDARRFSEYTRAVDYGTLHGTERTVEMFEKPASAGHPYYPIRNEETDALREDYLARDPGITFLGRLGTYQYLNMDQVVGQSLAAARKRGL